MLMPRQTLVGRWGQEVGCPIPLLSEWTAAGPSSQVCATIIVPMIVSRCCGLTGLGLGQGASPPSPTHHPCQSGTIELDHPSSPRLSPSNLHPAQLLGRGSQTPFLALTLHFLCDLRRWLAFPEVYFLDYRMGTYGSKRTEFSAPTSPHCALDPPQSGTTD